MLYTFIYFQVVQCHGSFATASCTVCKVQVPADAIREDIFERRIPLCTLPRCKDLGEDRESKETTSSSTPTGPSDSQEPSLSTKTSTGLVGGVSDLEVPDTSAANATEESCEKPNATESCDNPTAPSYVPPKSVMKPDIVFFGEGLPDHFHQVFVFGIVIVIDTLWSEHHRRQG